MSYNYRINLDTIEAITYTNSNSEYGAYIVLSTEYSYYDSRQ